MRITHYNGVAFADLGVSGKLERGNFPGPYQTPVTLQRAGATALLSAITQDVRTFTVSFQTTSDATDFEQALVAILGATEIGRDEDCWLEGELNDGTDVRVKARVGGYRYDSYLISVIYVDFYAADPVWREYDATETDPDNVVLVKGANGFALPNEGKARAWPTIKIQQTYTATRGTTQTLGWSKRRTVDITNNTTRDWHNQIVFVEIGDSATLVTGSKALASGDDYRVFYQGRQLPRSFIGWNTSMTVMAVRVSIPASDTVTLELVYDNDAATANDPYDLNTGVSITTALGASPNYPDVWTPINLENAVGTASGGTNSTMTGVTGGDAKWQDGYVAIYSGTGATQFRKIFSFVGNVVTVTRNWTTNPDATSKYIVWRSGLHVDGGRASAGAASTLTDASQAWDTDEWEGATLILQSGTGSGQTATVTGNTATVLTISGTWSTNPDNTTGYRIKRLGAVDYWVDTTSDLETLSQNNYGGWLVSPTRPTPSIIRYGDKIAGAWTPALYLANNDDVAQSRALSGSSDDMGVLRARRSKGSTHGYPGQGAADGVALYVPVGLQGIKYNYQFKNTNGKGKFVFAVQPSGGEDWSNVVESSTTHATLTGVTAAYKHLVDYGTPVRAGFFVLPADDVSFDGAATDDESEIQWYTLLRLYYDVDGITVGSISSEDAIYQIAGSIYLNGGPTHDGIGDATGRMQQPYYRLDIGGTDHSVFLRNLSDYNKLHINLDPANVTTPPVWISEGTDETFVTPAPWAVVVNKVIPDLEGDGVESVVGIGASISPSTNRLTNPSFDSNDTGWTGTANTGTGTFARDGGATYYGGTAGSGKVTITANAVVDGSMIYHVTGPVFTVRAGEILSLGGACHTSTASLRPKFFVAFYSDAGGTTPVTSPVPGVDLIDSWNYNPSSGTWYPRAWSTLVPDDAVAGRVYLLVESDAAVTGNCHFDAFYCGADLIFYTDAHETDMGSTEITATVLQGYSV